jgi:predicted DNA-binding transcriptional regulator YafY
MLETSGRMLRLLSLLQSRREWSGSELAEQLGVTVRTVRRDVDRLRQLGYPVDAERGTAGYRLGVGADLPPLLLDDDEAVAMVIGLRTAAASSVSGIEETSLRALTKLEQVLPSRLRHRVKSLQRAARRAGGSGPPVDADVLLQITDACVRCERLQFDYLSHRGEHSVRMVEPHAVVNWERHWYLVAWDTRRDDWRTFRMDRIRPKDVPGPRFAPRDLPDGDVTDYLSRTLSTGPWELTATVTLHVSAAEASERIWPGMGAVEPVDDSSCLLHVGAPSAADLAWIITATGIDFTVTDPPELVEEIRSLGARCRRATATSTGSQLASD